MPEENIHPAAAYARRIASLEDKISVIREDIREIYTEAKEGGCLKGAVREVVKRLIESEDQRLSREAVEAERDQALASLGMLDGKPLSEARQAALDEDEPWNDEPAEEAPPKRNRGRPRTRQPAAEELDSSMT